MKKKICAKISLVMVFVLMLIVMGGCQSNKSGLTGTWVETYESSETEAYLKENGMSLELEFNEGTYGKKMIISGMTASLAVGTYEITDNNELIMIGTRTDMIDSTGQLKDAGSKYVDPEKHYKNSSSIGSNTWHLAGNTLYIGTDQYTRK